MVSMNRQLVRYGLPKWMLLFLHVQAFSLGQITLVHSPASMTAAVGSNCLISCAIHGDGKKFGSKVHTSIIWYKRDPKGDEIKLTEDNKTTIITKVNEAKPESIIRFSNVDIPQEGMYYCKVSLKIATGDHINVTEGPGKGINLTVQAQPLVPVLHVESMNSSNTVNYICMSGGFYPGRINVTWVINGYQSPAAKVQVIKSGVRYNVSSVFSEEEEGGDCGESEIYCQIQHDSLKSPVSSNRIFIKNKGCTHSRSWLLAALSSLAFLVIVVAAAWCCRRRGCEKVLKTEKREEITDLPGGSDPTEGKETEQIYANVHFTKVVK
nr:PREDICTED: uncharacterized protein LOC106705708 [Latimeria chalumnae]|eukprot:XP_014351069.1 PREDICTED: uncharacterized protein LOC106705708 [Latimeria chalumnae]